MKMGKKLLVLAILALALPMAAFADSQLDFSNSGGTLSGSNSGLSLSGSTLSTSGFGGGFNMGTLSLSTGSLTSGNITWGATFNGGGSFNIAGSGSNGIPAGTLFSGTFSGPVSWTMTTGIDGTHTYTLSGIVNGSAIGGISVGDVNVQFSINTGKGYFSGSSSRVGGSTVVTLVTPVPEPGSLALMGAGMIGLAGAVRRKIKKQA
jgi:hypothetical protein